MTDQKPHRISIPKYSLSEELLNAISHGLGALFGIVGTVLCIVKAANTGDPWRIVSGSIFGVTVLLLYLMSCLYHALKVNMAKRVFRVIDHCTIFLLHTFYIGNLARNRRLGAFWNCLGNGRAGHYAKCGESEKIFEDFRGMLFGYGLGNRSGVSAAG